MEKARALAVAVGTGYAYETTFQKEVFSDLYGERGVVRGLPLSAISFDQRLTASLDGMQLMGGIQGMFLAQYQVLRENGHSPSEAFNETVEEATQSLFPLIGKYGMDYMYNACSTTARRGALDWAPKFEAANLPVFRELYQSCKDGSETRRSLEFNGRKTYREDLQKELDVINNQEIWRAGKAVRVRLHSFGLFSRPRSLTDLETPPNPVDAASGRSLKPGVEPIKVVYSIVALCIPFHLTRSVSRKRATH